MRPSRAKPKTGWSLRELAALSGVAARTIKLWVTRGVMPRPPFRGSATRYQSQHLVWVLAIRRLRTTEKLTLSKIRTRLQALAAPDLETFATENLPAGAVADALGIRASIPPISAVGPVSWPALYAADGGVPQTPRWARFELALGLELHVRDDASAAVLEMARRLRELSAPGRV